MMDAVSQPHASTGMRAHFPNSALSDEVAQMLFVSRHQVSTGPNDPSPETWQFKPIHEGGTLDWLTFPNEPSDALHAAESLKLLGSICVERITKKQMTPTNGAHVGMLTKLLNGFGDAGKHGDGGKQSQERIFENNNTDDTYDSEPGITQDLSNYVTLMASLSIIERRCMDLYLESENNKTGKPLFSEILSSDTLSRLIVTECHGHDDDATSIDDFAKTWPLRLALHPNCMNLRNVAWHGFLAPPDVSDELAALVLTMACSIPGRVSHETDADLNTHRNSSKDIKKLTRCDEDVFSKNENEVTVSAREIQRNVLGSSFFPRGWRDAVSDACGVILEGRHSNPETLNPDASLDSKWRTFAFIVVVAPAVEHALRLLYADANNAPEVIDAKLNTYYATLDGYGQASTHDVLLHPRRAPGTCSVDEKTSSGGDDKNLERNKFREKVPACLRFALEDLFMREKGPSLRATYAHGSVPICEEDDMYGQVVIKPSTNACAYLLLAAASDLCLLFESDLGGFKFTPLESSSSFLKGYRPVFHPVTRVRDAQACALKAVTNIQTANHSVRFGDDDALVTFFERDAARVAFHAKRDADETVFKAKEDEAALVEVVKVALDAWNVVVTRRQSNEKDVLGSVARAFLQRESSQNVFESPLAPPFLDEWTESPNGMECLRTAAGEVRVACETHLQSIESAAQATDNREARSAQRKRLVANVACSKSVQAQSLALLLLLDVFLDDFVLQDDDGDNMTGIEMRRRLLSQATALRVACELGHSREAVQGAVKGWKQNAGRAMIKKLKEIIRNER